jgi:hypothetical protein
MGGCRQTLVAALIAGVAGALDQDFHPIAGRGVGGMHVLPQPHHQEDGQDGKQTGKTQPAE